MTERYCNESKGHMARACLQKKQNRKLLEIKNAEVWIFAGEPG